MTGLSKSCVPAAGGGRWRFEECYEAHRHDVYRLGLRFAGGRRAFAEDVTHDVFLKLLEHLPRGEEILDMGAWLYRVTANTAISRLRREQSFFARVRKLCQGGDAGLEPSPAAAFERQEVAAAAQRALGRLPARERVVLCMKLLDGKSQREIAQILSMSEGYVSKLLARARRRIEATSTEADHVEVE